MIIFWHLAKIKKNISTTDKVSSLYYRAWTILECTSFNKGLDICETSHINEHICVQIITRTS